MKKLLLLFSVVALTFTSCGNDDDATTPDPGTNQDPLIGTWNFHQYFEGGVESTYDLCDFEDNLIFDSNGSLTSNEYEENIAGGCDLEYISISTWVNVGDGLYKITDEDDDSYTVKVLFEDNKMYLDEIEDDILYREVYIKQ